MNKLKNLCNPPPFEYINVAVLGSWIPLGKTIALLLKQCQGIDTLKLYSPNRVACATAIDLSHIDTNTKIKAYQGGSNLLAEAVKDSQIILICGGETERASDCQYSIFNRNVDAVRYFALHIAEYNPDAIVLCTTPPINSMIPMICEEFKKANVYNSRKIIGPTNIASIRANSIIARHIKENPTHVLCPTIGGLCPKSTVAVLSQTTPKLNLTEKEVEDMMWKISNAELHAVEKKCAETTGSCYLSSAFASTRFINTLIKAMRGEANCYECAYVRQTGHIGEFLPYMATMCKFGPHGVDETFMPKINDKECKELKKAYPYIKKGIEVGTSFVTGEVFRDRKVSKLLESDYCSTFIANPVEVVGDVTVDLSKKYRRFKIFQ